MRIRIPESTYNKHGDTNLQAVFELDDGEFKPADGLTLEIGAEGELTEELARALMRMCRGEDDFVAALIDGDKFAVVSGRCIVSNFIEIPPEYYRDNPACESVRADFDHFEDKVVLFLVDKDRGNEPPYIGIVQVLPAEPGEEEMSEEEIIGHGMAAMAGRLNLKDLSDFSKTITTIGCFPCSSTSSSLPSQPA
jgi:hypothetical protein